MEYIYIYVYMYMYISISDTLGGCLAGLLELEQFMAPFVPVLQHLQAFFAQVLSHTKCFQRRFEKVNSQIHQPILYIGNSEG